MCQTQLQLDYNYFLNVLKGMIENFFILIYGNDKVPILLVCILRMQSAIYSHRLRLWQQAYGYDPLFCKTHYLHHIS